MYGVLRFNKIESLASNDNDQNILSMFEYKQFFLNKFFGCIHNEAKINKARRILSSKHAKSSEIR